MKSSYVSELVMKIPTDLDAMRHSDGYLIWYDYFFPFENYIGDYDV